MLYILNSILKYYNKRQYKIKLRVKFYQKNIKCTLIYNYPVKSSMTYKYFI